MELHIFNRVLCGSSWTCCIFYESDYAFAKKKAAAQNPWGEGATTLEWSVPSPPNFHTFEELPKFEDGQDTQKSHG